MLEPVVWFVIAMLTYFICTGGIVYSIIHNVPWFKMDRDQYGTVYISEYFMKGQRGQWAGEGYIFSVLVCTTGFILIFLSKVDDFVKKNSHRRIAVISCLALMYFLTEMMLVCYKYKSPWYGPGFSPPGHYQRGPLMADQGNNIWEDRQMQSIGDWLYTQWINYLFQLTLIIQNRNIWLYFK